MGQKIHPTGFRLPVTRNWASRWYASNANFATMLAEDLRVRDFLKARLKSAAVSRILIERPAKSARVTIFSARPGVVIGKKGEDIEKLKAELTRRMGVPVAVNIEEVRKPEVDAQLIADSITQQLEKRIMFRRAMKRAMQNAMRLGAQGVKIMSAGRLNGHEIARTEWYREGRVPLHTLRADIDFGMGAAKTSYGVIGIKVWVYKGEVMPRGEQAALASTTAAPAAAQPEAPSEPKRAKKPAPKVGAKRAPAKKAEGAKADGEKKPTRKADAPAPKTTVKRAKKIVKDDEGGEKKE